MNGLDAAGLIRKKNINSVIVVISTHDTARMAYDATVKGAHEFYSKDIFTSKMSQTVRDEILSTLKTITAKKKNLSGADISKRKIIEPRKISAVVIASSTGGPKALSQLCAGLPENISVPIILVQHNTSGFDKGFVQWLAGFTKLNVCLAKQGVMPVKGNLYVAPTDRHLLAGNKGFVLNDGPPVLNQKPAADELFRSASAFYGKSLISAVLTGMARTERREQDTSSGEEE
jgi:two-component system chemotaxis response regulator CheB